MAIERAWEPGAYGLPTPEQLFKIASIGICLAKNQGKFRGSREKENAHLFLADELEYVEIQKNDDQQTTHKFIGRVGRIGYKHWSMRLAEAYWVSKGGNDDGYRLTYKFEWTDKDTLIAQRHLHAKEDEDDIPFGFSINPETVDDLMFEPDFLNAVNQFGHVSKADAESLTRSMQLFSDTSARVLHYNR